MSPNTLDCKQTGLYSWGMGKKRAKSDARRRILETSEKLFYAEGIRNVGIARNIAEAGVATMSLYNHFASKDDLILAVLQYREEQFDGMFEKWMQRHVKKGLGRLEACFAALKDWFRRPGLRGCAFLNATVELADAEHAASQVSAAHKALFRERLTDILADTGGASKAAAIAPAIALMVEGAIVTAVIEQKSDSADVAKQAALALVSNISRKRT